MCVSLCAICVFSVVSFEDGQQCWSLYLATDAELLSRPWRWSGGEDVCVSEVEMDWQEAVKRSFVSCQWLSAEQGSRDMAARPKVLHLFASVSDAGRTDQMVWDGLVQSKPLLQDDYIICCVFIWDDMLFTVISGQELVVAPPNKLCLLLLLLLFFRLT